MREKLLALAAILAFALPAGAETKYQIFNHLSAGVSVGSTGVGIEVGTCLTKYVGVRAGVDIMPAIKFHPEVDAYFSDPQGGSVQETVRLNANFKRVQGQLMVDVYPFGGKFFATAGLVFGGQKLVEADGQSLQAERLMAAGYGDGVFDAGGYHITLDKNGYASAALEVKKVRPYFGIGFGGRCVPKHRLSMRTELGVQIHGHAKVTGDHVTLNGTDPDNTLSTIINKLTVWPVLKFSLVGRIL